MDALGIAAEILLKGLAGASEGKFLLKRLQWIARPAGKRQNIKKGNIIFFS